MTTEERKKAALDDIFGAAIPRENVFDMANKIAKHADLIKELLQPTPQNREADMPDEIYADPDEYAHGHLNAYHTSDLGGVRYIRADLANKPALDAEVLEACVRLETLVHRCRSQNDYSREEMHRDLETLIRAASAVQEPEEVTVEELVAEITKESNLQSKVFKFESYHWYFAAETILNKYPNGIKIIKDK